VANPDTHLKDTAGVKKVQPRGGSPLRDARLKTKNFKVFDRKRLLKNKTVALSSHSGEVKLGTKTIAAFIMSTRTF